jgi:5'-nucleotidase
MLSRIRIPLVAAFVAIVSACAAPGLKSRPTAEPGLKPRPTADSVVTATILQMNDVYEIMPLGGSGLGGLARVATLRKQLAAENPNTFTVLAGDLVSPSALSSAKAGDGGTALNGRQMIDLMNRVGLQYAVFGNHEFDLKQPDFDARMAESKFQWISANVRGAAGAITPAAKDRVVVTATNAAGRQLRIGMFGLTIDSNKAAYVRYLDPIATAKAQIAALQPDTDIVIALTHLAFAEDESIAELAPGLSMIIGGHEHQNIDAYRGPQFVPILKADSNAKSVYVHHLRYDTATKQLDVDSDLVEVTAAIAEDPDVAAAAAGWRDRGFAAFKAGGIDPEKTVTTLTEMLDGREASIRTGNTNLTQALNAAMIASFAGAQASIFNSGSIRIDDTLGPGPITQYDVLRVLPYPGNLFLTSMKGSVLTRMLTDGRSTARMGSGGFLQAGGVTQSDSGAWTLGGAAIDPDADYKVVMNDYLLNGLENGLEWIKPATSGIVVMPDAPVDFRVAVIGFRQRSSSRD